MRRISKIADREVERACLERLLFEPGVDGTLQCLDLLGEPDPALGSDLGTDDLVAALEKFLKTSRSLVRERPRHGPPHSGRLNSVCLLALTCAALSEDERREHETRRPEEPASLLAADLMDVTRDART